MSHVTSSLIFNIIFVILLLLFVIILLLCYFYFILFSYIGMSLPFSTRKHTIS